jgi:hypothetical protein
MGEEDFRERLLGDTQVGDRRLHSGQTIDRSPI